MCPCTAHPLQQPHSRAATPAAFPPPSAQGTVLIRSAEELEGYSRGEEARIEEIIKSIAGGWAERGTRVRMHA